MDRNQLEQDALQQIGRGNLEGGLRSYQAILKLDPRDRRIRQKLGELLVRMNRLGEAERQFREVADALVREGNHRGAVAVYKQLVTLRPDDPALQYDLGDAYVNSGYPNDARQHFDAAMRQWLSGANTVNAAKAAKRLADLSPGDPTLKLRVCELLEAGGETRAAVTLYQEVIEEYRRRGRPDEVGRVAELALKLVPEDVGLLLDAAAARVEGHDWRRALAHLQIAFQRMPTDRRVLDLLAQAFVGGGQTEKALRVLGELARVCAETGDSSGEAEALRRAVAIAPDDPALRQRLADVEARVTRLERRLTSLVLSQPADEEELRALVRAEVYQRYGFPERADAVLREALERRGDSLPLLAGLAEAWVASGKVDEAVRIMERLSTRAGAERDAVLDRIVVVRGGSAASDDVDVAELTPEDETAEERGDRLAAAGDLQGAMLAWREALSEDPMNEAVLGKIASLRTRARAASPPEERPDEGTFAEVAPEALEVGEDEVIHEARSLVEVGMWAEAVKLVEGIPRLDARVIHALALKGMGDSAGALDVLRDATNDATETDPGYAEALFELSALYAVTGKHRAALRLLEELVDLDPTFRRDAVEARIRALQKVAR